MSLPLVSIIIPVYNVENYLTDCLDSVINQTYTNLEIIIVDDGSTDNSSFICDEFAKKDSRIRIFHKKNGGLSDARNVGLNAAVGDYITFIDSDDYFEKEAINKLVSHISKQNKIIDFGTNFVNENHEILSVHKFTNALDFSDDYLKKVCNNVVGSSVCGKLFDKRLISDTRFVVGKTNEDFHFLVSILLKNKFYICTIDFGGYNYLQREGSITHSVNKSSVLDSIENCVDLFSIANKNNISFSKPYIARMALHQSCVALIIDPYYKSGKDSKFFSISVKTIKMFKKYISHSKLTLKEKLICRLACIFPRLTSIIFHRLYLLKNHN